MKKKGKIRLQEGEGFLRAFFMAIEGIKNKAK